MRLSKWDKSLPSGCTDEDCCCFLWRSGPQKSRDRRMHPRVQAGSLCAIRFVSESDSIPAMKITFDVSLVALAVVLSLIFTGHIAGIREGTVAAAVFVGLTAKAAHRLIHRAPAADPGA